MEDHKQKKLFEELPPAKAVLAAAVPTALSQIISIVYNTADTFFMGQLGDPNRIAAVAIAAPLALILTALANLLGIGGAGVFAASIGEKKEQNARAASSFAILTSIGIGAVFMIVILAFFDPIMMLLGANTDNLPFVKEYVFWACAAGAIPSLTGMVLSHFVRADGEPKLAGGILSASGILNFILDPVFIFDWGLGWGITGAAAATFAANLFTAAAFTVYFLRRRGATLVNVTSAGSCTPKLAGRILGAGLPGMLQTLLASVSNMVLNNLAGLYGSSAQAAFGVVKKLDQVPMSITIGFAQGIVPLAAYNHASGCFEREKKILKAALAMTVGISLVFVVIYECFAGGLIRFFIDDAATVAAGIPILRIMCVSTPLMAVPFVITTAFQATKKARYALILSVLRKGALDIPLMFLMNLLIPFIGIAFAQPAAEGIAMAAALWMYRKFYSEY